MFFQRRVRYPSFFYCIKHSKKELDISCKEKILFNNLTITGALCNYISTENVNFQPMNANFGLLSPLNEVIKDKQKRKEAYSERAILEMRKIKEAIC